MKGGNEVNVVELEPRTVFVFLTQNQTVGQ